MSRSAKSASGGPKLPRDKHVVVHPALVEDVYRPRTIRQRYRSAARLFKLIEGVCVCVCARRPWLVRPTCFSTAHLGGHSRSKIG